MKNAAQHSVQRMDQLDRKPRCSPGLQRFVRLHCFVRLMGLPIRSILRLRSWFFGANCITENVTMRRIVASGKMLLSDRRKRLLEERHDEPERQARVVRSSTTQIPEREEGRKAENLG